MKLERFCQNLVLLLAVASALFATAAIAFGAQGSITYQGRLQQNGQNVTGLHDFVFQLHANQAGDLPIGDPVVQQGVQVSEGLFAVELDFGAGAFENGPRWMEIQVDGVALSGLQEVTAAPMSAFALNAPFQRQDNSLLLGNAMHVGLGGVDVPESVLHLDATGGGKGVRVDSDSTSQHATSVWGRLTSPSIGSNASAVYGEVSGSLMNPNGVAIRGIHLGPGVAVDALSYGGTALRAQTHAGAGYAAYLLGRTYVSSLLGVGIEDPEAPIHAATTQQIVQINESSHASGTWLNLTNTSPGGATWSLLSTGSANGGGPGNLIFRHHDEGVNVMMLNSGGNVGIGATAPAFKLHVNGSAGKPGGGSWSVASDERLKTNVAPIRHALDHLLSIKGVTFEYRDSAAVNELPGRQIGVLAQQIEKAFPQWVDEGSDGYKRVTFRGFEAMTIEAMRELRDRIEARAAALEKENAALRERLDRLEALMTQRTATPAAP